MAIAVAFIAGNQTVATQSTFTTASLTLQPGEAVGVTVAVGSPSGVATSSVTSITGTLGTQLSWITLGGTNWSSASPNRGRIEQWYAKNTGGSALSGTLIFNYSVNMAHCHWVLARVTGAADNPRTGAANATSATTFGTGSNPSVTFGSTPTSTSAVITGAFPNANVLGGFASGYAALGSSPGTTTSPAARLVGGSDDSAPGVTVTTSGMTTAVNKAVIASEIAVASGATINATVALTGTSTLTVTGAVAHQKIVNLVDTFDTEVDKTTKWPGSSTQVVWDASGQAKIPCTTSYYSLSTDTSGTYDLTGASVYVKLTFPGAGAGSRQAAMELIRGGVSNDKVTFHIDGSNLTARRTIGGVDSNAATPVTYSAVNHAWLRIRESAGTVYFDTSDDGDLWTNFHSTAPGWDVSDVWLSINSGYWGTESAADTYVDNVNTPPAVVVDATVALAATSTLTTAGVRQVPATVALTGVSTLTATAVRAPQASVPLTATSTLVATALRTAVATVALSGTATLTTSGVVTEFATVALSAASTLTTTGVRAAVTVVPLTAASTLTVTGVVSKIATVSLSAASTLTATALRTAGGSVPLAATSTLTVTATVSGAPVVSATVAMTAASTLTVTGVRAGVASVALAATATLATQAVRASVASVALVGTSTLTTTGTVTHVQTATVALSATATLTTTGFRQRVASVPLVGTSTLTATATTLGQVPASAALTASSTLTAAGVRVQPATVAMTATALLVSTGLRVQVASVTLSASSTLTAAGVRIPQGAVDLVGFATLIATPVRVVEATVGLFMVSVLTVTATKTTGGAIPNVAGDGLLHGLDTDLQWYPVGAI